MNRNLWVAVRSHVTGSILIFQSEWKKKSASQKHMISQHIIHTVRFSTSRFVDVRTTFCYFRMHLFKLWVTNIICRRPENGNFSPCRRVYTVFQFRVDPHILKRTFLHSFDFRSSALCVLCFFRYVTLTKIKYWNEIENIRSKSYSKTENTFMTVNFRITWKTCDAATLGRFFSSRWSFRLTTWTEWK